MQRALNALNRQLDISFGIGDADATNSPDERRSRLACNRRVSRDTLVEYPCDVHYARFQCAIFARALIEAREPPCAFTRRAYI